jgi:ABC-2 type transport system permease protein
MEGKNASKIYARRVKYIFFMKHFFHLFTNELKMLLFSPATYVAGVVFLFLQCIFYLNMIAEFSQNAQEILASEMFFKTFWIPVWFLVPLLTMKSLAEERRQGTLDTLMTTPVTSFEIILSKFFASYLLYCVLWGATLLFPVLTALYVCDGLASEWLLDFPSLIGGYIFVIISGALFVAVGIFTSSFTRTQLIAGMLSFSILFIITIGATLLQNANLSLGEWLDAPVQYLKIFKHLEDFSRGVIDSRPLFFYPSCTFLMIGLSSLIVRST